MEDVIRMTARAFEQDRYLSALLAPRQVRSDLITLYAFAGDIGRIPSVVSDPMIGEIRLQWWRDALEAGRRGQDSGHPICDRMVDVARRHALPDGLLLGVVDSQSGLVQGAVIEDDQGLKAYLAKRESGLFALAWRILEGPDRGEEPPMLQEAGQVYGRARLLSEFAGRLAEGQLVLPLEYLGRFGVDVAALRRGEASGALLSALEAFREDVRLRFRRLVEELPGASRNTRRVLLPLALVEPYLSAQEKLGPACVRVAGDVGPLNRIWRLWWAHRFGTG